MSRRVKELMVEEYARRFSDLGRKGCVVLGYQGLDANTANEVRKILDDHNSEMLVICNRLMALSLEEIGMPQLKGHFQGPVAMVTASDPVQAAKAVSSVREEYPVITVLGGYAEGKMLDDSDVGKLSDIPDREVLLARTLGLFASPAQRFVNGINNAITGFVSVVQQLKAKKENG